MNIPLSKSQKNIARLCLNIVKSPLDYKNHINLYHYNISLHTTGNINYIPPVFNFAVTSQCNLRCPTCLLLLENKDVFETTYTSPETFRKLLDKINPDNKGLVMFLSGGEPLLHPEIGEFVRISREYGFLPKISTNGILIRDRIDQIMDVDYINVSLDSYDYSTFKENRGGTPLQFEKILFGIELLKAHGINFSVSFLLSQNNLHEVGKMLEFAESIGAPMVNLHNINPHGSEEYKPLTMQNPETANFLKSVTERTDYPFDLYLPVIFDIESESFKETKCIQPWYYYCFNGEGVLSRCCHLSHNPINGTVYETDPINTFGIVNFRRYLMNGFVPPYCKYCQRRFMDAEYGRFDKISKTWILHNNRLH